MDETALQRMVNHAYNEVAYYHNLFDSQNISPDSIRTPEDLQRLPLLSKSDVQKDVSSFIAAPYQKYPKNKRLELRRTSGSTGKYLKIFWDYHDGIRSLYPLWKRRNVWYGIDPTMNYCTFFSVDYSGNKIVEPVAKKMDPSGRQLAFSKFELSHQRLQEYYQDILKFNPHWFSMQPSVALLLAQYVIENQLVRPSNLKYIELTGERLRKDCRDQIQQAFAINPTNMYGLNEVNSVAVECTEGHLHVLTDNVIVEVLKNGESVLEEEGGIYVTCLTNYAMPFIRYETGDRGIIRRAACSCGKEVLILELSTGRESEYVQLKDGEKMNYYTLVSAVEYANEYMSNAIKQFQFVQEEYDRIKVTLSLKPAYRSWENAVKETFLNNIKEPALRSMHWEILFTEDIYPDPVTGKLKSFVPLQTVSEKGTRHHV